MPKRGGKGSGTIGGTVSSTEAATLADLKRTTARRLRERDLTIDIKEDEIVVLDEEIVVLEEVVEQGGTDVTAVVDDLRAKQVLVKADLVTIRSEVNTQHAPGIWPVLDDLLVHMDEECDAILAAYPEGWPT
jgi:hypothetical protein